MAVHQDPSRAEFHAAVSAAKDASKPKFLHGPCGRFGSLQVSYLNPVLVIPRHIAIIMTTSIVRIVIHRHVNGSPYSTGSQNTFNAVALDYAAVCVGGRRLAALAALAGVFGYRAHIVVVLV